MSVKKFAAEMKSTIEEIKANGTTAIYCENLIAYLDQVLQSTKSSPSGVDIELYKAQLRSSIEENKHRHESSLEMFRSVIVAGQSAIKSAFLLNGGAAVAILAFIAHLIQVDKSAVEDFSCCLLLFSFGTLTAAATAGFTYLTQWFYAGGKTWAYTAGVCLNILCILLGFSSYGLFAWGLFAARSSFALYG